MSALLSMKLLPTFFFLPPPWMCGPETSLWISCPGRPANQRDQAARFVLVFAVAHFVILLFCCLNLGPRSQCHPLAYASTFCQPLLLRSFLASKRFVPTVTRGVLLTNQGRAAIDFVQTGVFSIHMSLCSTAGRRGFAKARSDQKSLFFLSCPRVGIVSSVVVILTT